MTQYQPSQLNTILETIAAIQLTCTIPGGSINSAFAYPVVEPNQANTPFFYNEFKGGPVNPAAVQGYRVMSDIDMVLCVTNWNSEMSLERVYTLVSYWRDAVLFTFASHLRLGGNLPNVVDAFISNISEFQKISTESGAEWGALTFTLHVTEQFSAPFAQ